ncbi:MAG: hypothetical protein KAH77_11640, partial [Thiomargarita sp.]|nr:hypothetical protein [Thiomargarita sp.]
MHNWFNNLKIRKKLLLAFMLMIALSLITSIIALSSYQRIGMNMVDLIDGEGKISDLSLKIQTAMLLARRYEKDYLLRYKQVGFKAAREKYLTKIH